MAATQQLCVPWRKLLDWVQQQIDTEAETGQPIALTRLQLEAVSHLIPFNEEPNVSDKDYVSLLLQSTQSRRLGPPTFTNPEPVSMPIDGHFEPRWQCFCDIRSVGKFPRLGYGMSTTQPAPWFQSKKNAKQFAAKQALDFLSLTPSTVHSGPSLLDKRPWPTTPHEKVSRPKWEPAPMGSLAPPSSSLAPMPSAMPSSVPSLTTSAPSIPLPPPTTSTLSAPDANSASSKNQTVFEQVAALAGRMGIDSPSYKIEPDPAGGDTFCGRPIFRNGGRVPLELGMVKGAESPSQAKMRVAEEVLTWLDEEMQRRQAVFQNIWSKASE
ncbi:hypothetical protein E4U60_007914 [Claviceps pazoutovae]|uniref:DRBM domain-containing protein n=1 Tax=Claviceps pazoutovae TaxID=1649127 RepID=A0A9P7MEZ7_9HYPO|nr:hypothetical protein E4U60_007914 [Claviceps pazoutovae]